MNKFLIKGFAGTFLISSACSVSNYCSALREFPDWFYGEGNFPEDAKEWFGEQLILRINNLTDACVKLEKNFNENNKFLFKESLAAYGKFMDALNVRKITLYDLLTGNMDPFEKAFDTIHNFEKIVHNMPEEIQDFIKESENRWVPGSFGAGF